jgi:hypothetical protein
MVSANLEVAETIKCDYTNTECFWRLIEMTKNIVLVTREEKFDVRSSMFDVEDKIKAKGKRQKAKAKNIKFQITNSKSQINSKLQIPMTQTKSRNLEGLLFWKLSHWCLVLVCNLVLGIWNFIFPRHSLLVTRHLAAY